jgi:putative copper export protein/mono/diheme cytochrome c family protein
MTDLAAVARFVHAAAAVLLVGAFSFTIFVARPTFRRMNAPDADFPAFLNLQLRIAHWCWLALFASALFGLWLQTAAVSASADGDAVVTLLKETQYGQVWSARMVNLFLLPAVFFFAKRRGSNATAWATAGFLLSAALLLSLALVGHSAAAEGGALIIQILVDALHLLATGIWLGGLVPLALSLRQLNRKADSAALAVAGAVTRRFSALALGCVVIVIVTGAYNAWTLVGGFAPLFGTPYGKLLLLKVSLLLPLLVVAAVNLLRLKSQLANVISSEDALATLRKLKHNVMTEALLGAAILLVVGYMGVTPPARHVQPDWPFSTRWDWSVLEKAPTARAEAQRGMVWALIGGIALIAAMARRQRRVITALIGVGALAYAGSVTVDAVSTDAYPTTYNRPAVAYQAISVANGKQLYEDNGCASCHGSGGYGDGPLAEELRPKPADLTAPHANAHTAGDLFWWLSHGVKNTAMPGFEQSISEDDRWDLINFMRALASGDRARSLAPVIENEPWLVAPDFSYLTNRDEAKTLRDHRGGKIILLVLLDVQSTEERLKELGDAAVALQSANVETIIVPNLIDLQNVADRLPGFIVTEGIREIAETYKLFARSFSDEALVAPRHVEFLIDKQGYIRARWLPTENTGWRKLPPLLQQIELLNREKRRAPAPDDHVH